MKRLCLLVFVLLLAGCSAEDKRQWDDAWRDARGDNMEMRTMSSRPRTLGD